MRLTPVGKIIAFMLAIGAAFGIYKLTGKGNLAAQLIPTAKTQESEVPKPAPLPIAPDSAHVAPAASTRFTRPGTGPGAADKPEVRMLVWAWNSQMGLMLANGGPQATQGSLMAKHGVNLKLERQDDTTKMQEALTAFATELSQGNRNPSKGAHFVAVMGDGAGAFLKGLNDQLKRLGPEYQAKIIGSCGYSRGEDKFMGPAEWKANPSASRGGLVAGVLRDGDWNIAQKWLGDNGLKNNPDEKTWDPDALNWVAAGDYIDAGEKYIAGYSEDRPVVRNGKRTGETKKVTVQGCVTWTPGDVNVAQKKGGVVSIVSTREYASQMPNVIIGIDKWMKNNRPTVEGFLQAILEGGDLVKSSQDALAFAGEVSQQVYKESGADANYWVKYYQGVTEKDKTGQDVELGGSSVNNLADDLLLFGLVPGSSNLFAATYTVFGDIAVHQYPKLMPNYPSAAQVLDATYLQGIARRVGGATIAKEVESAKPKPIPVKSPSRVISRKAWHINFASGRASFSPSASQQLHQLLRDLLVAGGTTVAIHGHTDSQGNANANMQLSEQRAFAVKQWLEKQSPVNFPSGRVQVFAHGQSNPVAPNDSETGRAQNRRVEIVLGASDTK